MIRDIRYFGPNREPAVLVTDFGELTAGMVVWISPCRDCGQNHRHGVVNKDAEMIDVAPPPSCHPQDDTVIRRSRIADGLLFRVVDEPPAKTESRTRRRKLVTS